MTDCVWTVDVSRDVGHFQACHQPHHYDVLVVGGGITGLTTAALCKQKGKSVAVLESLNIGTNGTTCHSSAHLTALPDVSILSLIKSIGPTKTKDVISFNQEAINNVEKFQKQFDFVNDFHRVSNYIYTENESDVHHLQEEAAHARSMGLDVAENVELPLPFSYRSAYRIHNQAEFHPAKHVLGLANYVNHGTCNVYENSRVMKYSDSTSIKKCSVTLANGTVLTGDHLVLATHSPIGRWVSLQGRMTVNRSYCLIARLNTPIREGALYDDCEDPYHYVRDYGDLYTVLVGGYDHVQGQGDPVGSMNKLEEWTKSHFDVASITYKWSANLYNSPDGLPFIGKGPGCNNTYVATGFLGQGLSYGTMAGMILSDMIVQGSHPLQKTFSPIRGALWASLVMGVEEQYHAMLGLIKRFFIPRRSSAAASAVESLPLGGGTVVHRHGHNMAVHKKPDGTLEACSATCPHLGCTVTYNAVTSSWDCPCHGSTFSTDGTVLGGPSYKPLDTLQF